MTNLQRKMNLNAKDFLYYYVPASEVLPVLLERPIGLLLSLELGHGVSRWSALAIEDDTHADTVGHGVEEVDHLLLGGAVREPSHADEEALLAEGAAAVLEGKVDVPSKSERECEGHD